MGIEGAATAQALRGRGQTHLAFSSPPFRFGFYWDDQQVFQYVSIKFTSSKIGYRGVGNGQIEFPLALDQAWMSQ